MQSVTRVICVLAMAAFAGAQQYTDRFDNTNIQEILENHRLLEAYVRCVLDQGKCTPDGKELKGNIGDALGNDCAKCTSKQRSMSRTVMKHLINNEPGYWNQLVAKYDPEQKYSKKYEKELRSLKE